MDTYEYPLGVTFKASTPEHAAAHAFGGKPGDYLVTKHTDSEFNNWYQWLEVNTTDGQYIGEIHIVDKEKS